MWSGFVAIASVEVIVDAGETWPHADPERPPGRWAWSGWPCSWRAEPGKHELLCRARDEAGNEQPLDPPWNVGGYANNAVQRVDVEVR